MNVTTRKLLDFLNHTNDTNAIDQAFEVEGRDIGEKIASNILSKRAELRERNAYGFLDLEDVLDVKLIGGVRLEQMLSATRAGALDSYLTTPSKPDTVDEQLIEITRVAVSAAKQLNAVAKSAKKHQQKSDSEARDAQRKALQLFELAGFNKTTAIPKFAQRFLWQSKDFKDYYSTNDVVIRELEQNDKDVVIEFQTLAEAQFYCSGVDLEISGKKVIVKFVRTHFTSSGSAAVSADSSNAELLLKKVKLTVPKNSTLYINDTSTSLKNSVKKGGAGPGLRPPAAPVAVTGCPFYLCIHSNVAEDVGSPAIDAGHSWLTLHDGSGALIATYGLWPDDHADIKKAGLANGNGSDVRVNYIGDLGLGTYYYCVCITVAQRTKLSTAVGRNEGWRLTNTCASFASEIFEEVTGEDIDADEFLGFETPRELGESIREANGGTNAPSTLPTTPAGGAGGSSGL